MKRLLLLSLIMALLLCGCNSMDLYEYALTMEDSNSFACTNGSIYKSLNVTGNTNADGSISLVKSGDQAGWGTGATTSKTRAKNMKPHDFIFATGQTAYIRNDGSIWLDRNNSIRPFSPHDESVPDNSPYDLSLIIAPPYRDSSIKITLTNNGKATLPSPYIYLFVQLSDGSWYDAGNSNYIHHGAVRGVDYNSSIAPDGAYSNYTLLDIDIDMEQGETREYFLYFPKNGKKIIPGKYRIAVYSHLANETTLFNGNKSYHAYFTDTAQFEAYVEFDLSNAPFKTFKLSDFESTIEDLTVK